MPANEFEKNVQERLNDFQLNPSATVWNNVEALIRKRKKRRIFLIFLIPLLVGIGGLISYYSLRTSPSVDTGDKIISIKTIERKNEITPASESVNPPAKIVVEKTLDSPEEIEAGSSINVDVTQVTKSSAPAAGIPKNGKINFSILSATPSKKTNRKQTQRPNDTGNKVINESTLLNQGTDTQTTSVDTESTESKQTLKKDITVLEVPAIDSLVAGNEQIDSTGKMAISDSIQNVNEQKKQRPIVTSRKWQWGVEASAGMSSIRTEIFSVSVLSPEFDYYPTIPGVGSGGPLPIISPSAIRPGAAFSIGTVATKKLSGRLNLNIGLRYSYTSTNIRTGSRKDTGLVIQNGSQYTNTDRYYASGPTQNFTNRYHSLRLPVSIQWRAVAKLPIYFSLGGSAGYLFSTNALLYNRSLGGLYFHDKKAFNRFQYGLSTGISYGFQLKHSELQIGPTISMDMSEIAKENFDNKGYLIFGGLNFKYIFSEKKKR